MARRLEDSPVAPRSPSIRIVAPLAMARTGDNRLHRVLANAENALEQWTGTSLPRAAITADVDEEADALCVSLRVPVELLDARQKQTVLLEAEIAQCLRGVQKMHVVERDLATIRATDSPVDRLLTESPDSVLQGPVLLHAPGRSPKLSARVAPAPPSPSAARRGLCALGGEWTAKVAGR